ncbi:IS3 family transposase [Variovorax saccharolyticus]|uniref:IS3 family transposase n=1 Tax=Variovorax saccharolyticus TaxID=3053516 RepID=UPI0040379D37
MRRLLRAAEDGAVLSSAVAVHEHRAVIQVLDSYIRWYNEMPIKNSLGSPSPLEYRESPGVAA